jgi:hypothetical protein
MTEDQHTAILIALCQFDLESKLMSESTTPHTAIIGVENSEKARRARVALDDMRDAMYAARRMQSLRKTKSGGRNGGRPMAKQAAGKDK